VHSLLLEKLKRTVAQHQTVPTTILTTILTINMSLPTLPELSHTVSLLTLQVSELSERLSTVLSQIGTGTTVITTEKKRKSKKSSNESTNSSSSATATATTTSTKKVKEPKVKATCPPGVEGVVRFSGSTGKSPYIVFSPFYKAEFTLKDKAYPTVEHYVQSWKYEKANPTLSEELRTSDKPGTLRMVGNAKKHLEFVDPAYEINLAYRRGYTAQFGQHTSMLTVLKSTGTANLEGEYVDAQLGVGVDGLGANIIGNALSYTRDILSE